MPDVLTVEQVADRYQVSVWTIYKLAKDGKLPSVRFGGQLRFYADEVDAYLREHRGTAPTSAA